VEQVRKGFWTCLPFAWFSGFAGVGNTPRLSTGDIRHSQKLYMCYCHSSFSKSVNKCACGYFFSFARFPQQLCALECHILRNTPGHPACCTSPCQTSRCSGHSSHSPPPRSHILTHKSLSPTRSTTAQGCLDADNSWQAGRPRARDRPHAHAGISPALRASAG